jgi:hypothetical protein
MKKFTFIFEFEQGTYVKQIVSNSLEKSLPIWFDLLNEDEIPNMGEDVQKQLKLEIGKESPTLLQGMDNVWCMFFSIGNKTALLNIVDS